MCGAVSTVAGTEGWLLWDFGIRHGRRRSLRMVCSRHSRRAGSGWSGFLVMSIAASARADCSVSMQRVFPKKGARCRAQKGELVQIVAARGAWRSGHGKRSANRGAFKSIRAASNSRLQDACVQHTSCQFWIVFSIKHLTARRSLLKCPIFTAWRKFYRRKRSFTCGSRANYNSTPCRHSSVGRATAL